MVSKIPEFLEANLSGLEIGDSIHISSIELQDGVKPTITDRDFTIATLAPPTVMKVEESTKDAEAETESTEEVTEEKDSGKEKVDEKTQGSSSDDSEKKEN